MNARILRTIVSKDLGEVTQNRGVWAPAVIVPFVFLVLLPLGIILVPQVAHIPLDELFAPDSPVTLMMQNVPGFAGELAGLTDMQIWIVVAAGYLLMPFFLIMPLMLATIVGADSFVGEKERKTIEALIYTPATDAELFAGKMLAAVVPAVGLAWASFVVYALVVNAAAWPVMGRAWFPLAPWWPLILWVTPAVATLGLGFTVLISTRASTFMEAYQMSGSLVLLVLGLVAGQVTGVVFLSVPVGLALGLALWIADAVLLRFAVRTFRRERLLAGA